MSMLQSSRKIVTSGFAFGLSLGLSLALWIPSAPAAAAFAPSCTDENNFCFEQVTGSRWFPNAKTNSAMRKKRSEKEPGSLSLTIEGGRGSVFLNGRYLGTAPLDAVEVPSGPNDLHVRDGSEVLTWGILTVPKDDTVVAVVRHP
jgi:hypothetical protein